MKDQQTNDLLATVGGEPLEGSGFEDERPIFEDHLAPEDFQTKQWSDEQ